MIKHFGDNIHPHNLVSLKRIGYKEPGWYLITHDYYLIRVCNPTVPQRATPASIAKINAETKLVRRQMDA